QDVSIRVRPEMLADAALLVGRDGLGVLGVVGRTDPDVEHAVHRSEKAKEFAVRAEMWRSPVRVAEKDVAGYQTGLLPGRRRLDIASSRSHSARRLGQRWGSKKGDQRQAAGPAGAVAHECIQHAHGGFL